MRSLSPPPPFPAHVYQHLLRQTYGEPATPTHCVRHRGHRNAFDAVLVPKIFRDQWRRKAQSHRSINSRIYHTVISGKTEVGTKVRQQQGRRIIFTGRVWKSLLKKSKPTLKRLIEIYKVDKARALEVIDKGNNACQDVKARGRHFGNPKSFSVT